MKGRLREGPSCLSVAYQPKNRTVASKHRSLGVVLGAARRALEEIYGDKVVQLVVMSGRHTGPLMGREPTGKEFAVRHTNIWRIADDRIVDHWGTRDDLGLLGQLGLLRTGEAEDG